MQNNISNNFTEILVDKNLLDLADTQKFKQTGIKSLSLNNLINLSQKQADFCNNIKIILDKNIKINLLDDLFENLTENFDLNFGQKIEIILQENSFVNYFFKKTCKLCISKESVLINKEIIFKFVGQNSQAKAFCVIRSNKNNIFNIKTVQDHQASFTKSDLIINAILCQNSTLLCDNIICVPKLVKKIEAKQINRNLLLSSESKIISKPKLEIESDDVDCRHGAAMSRLDSEQLFFLQSRGLSYCQAKKTLINAFLSGE
ncbi:SufD family Fe-S cluster assembly protein [Candidatus Babeliales bacterium]|nr:SufD family Fe-S cluster assembly protein [Candidatus Babeliales bacterium]